MEHCAAGESKKANPAKKKYKYNAVTANTICKQKHLFKRGLTHTSLKVTCSEPQAGWEGASTASQTQRRAATEAMPAQERHRNFIFWGPCSCSFSTCNHFNSCSSITFLIKHQPPPNTSCKRLNGGEGVISHRTRRTNLKRALIQTRLNFQYHLQRLKWKVSKIHKITSKHKIIMLAIPSNSKNTAQAWTNTPRPQTRRTSNSDSFRSDKAEINVALKYHTHTQKPNFKCEETAGLTARRAPAEVTFTKCYFYEYRYFIWAAAPNKCRPWKTRHPGPGLAPEPPLPSHRKPGRGALRSTGAAPRNPAAPGKSLPAAGRAAPLTADDGADEGGVPRAVHQRQLQLPRPRAQLRRQRGAQAGEAQVQGDSPRPALRRPVEGGGGAGGAERPRQRRLPAVDVAQDTHVHVEDAGLGGHGGSCTRRSGPTAPLRQRGPRRRRSAASAPGNPALPRFQAGGTRSGRETRAPRVRSGSDTQCELPPPQAWSESR